MARGGFRADIQRFLQGAERKAKSGGASQHCQCMGRVLIIVGLAIAAVGALWPWLGKLGLGRLPGDVYIRGAHGSFYFPLVTSIVVSVVLSLILWFINR